MNPKLKEGNCVRQQWRQKRRENSAVLKIRKTMRKRRICNISEKTHSFSVCSWKQRFFFIAFVKIAQVTSFPSSHAGMRKSFLSPSCRSFYLMFFRFNCPVYSFLASLSSKLLVVTNINQNLRTFCKRAFLHIWIGLVWLHFNALTLFLIGLLLPLALRCDLWEDEQSLCT